MTVNITEKNGQKTLNIAIPMAENPQLSTSGKTRIVATTNGFAATPVMVDGKVVRVAINATIAP